MRRRVALTDDEVLADGAVYLCEVGNHNVAPLLLLDSLRNDID
jgi:hypothetical protein